MSLLTTRAPLDIPVLFVFTSSSSPFQSQFYAMSSIIPFVSWKLTIRLTDTIALLSIQWEQTLRVRRKRNQLLLWIPFLQFDTKVDIWNWQIRTAQQQKSWKSMNLCTVQLRSNLLYSWRMFGSEPFFSLISKKKTTGSEKKPQILLCFENKTCVVSSNKKKSRTLRKLFLHEKCIQFLERVRTGRQKNTKKIMAAATKKSVTFFF